MNYLCFIFPSGLWIYIFIFFFSFRNSCVLFYHSYFFRFSFLHDNLGYVSTGISSSVQWHCWTMESCQYLYLKEMPQVWNGIQSTPETKETSILWHTLQERTYLLKQENDQDSNLFSKRCLFFVLVIHNTNNTNEE